MVLSSGDLQCMREAVEGLLPDTCDVYEMVQTNVQGRASNTPTLRTSGVKCRLDVMSLRDAARMVAEREASKTYYRLTMAYGTNVDPHDRVRINGTDYEILQLFAEQSWATAVRAVVGRVD